MKKIALLGIAASLLFASCQEIRIDNHDDWASVFEENGVQGSFEYFDNNKERVHYYNKDHNSTQQNAGASYQLMASLIALETATAPTEQYTIPWDKQYRSYVNGEAVLITDTTLPGYRPEWNQDLSLTQAFQYNAVPYFQQLNLKMDTAEIHHYLDTVKFGNQKIGADLANFWQDGTLKISPDELVGFMKRLYHEQLKGFSPRSQRMTMGLMDKIQIPEKEITIYYKDYTTQQNDTTFVTYIGYVEKISNLINVKTKLNDAIPHPYFFCLNIYSTDKNKNMQAVGKKVFEEMIEKSGLNKQFHNDNNE